LKIKDLDINHIFLALCALRQNRTGHLTESTLAADLAVAIQTLKVNCSGTIQEKHDNHN
jgi:hypothetical protein